ncbi:MAG: ABC transporter ATP-binding protein [Phycisphaerae bacterium]
MKPFRRILSYLKPYRKAFAGGLVLLFLAQPLGLVNPLFWRFVVDEVLLAEKPRFVEVFGGSRIWLLAATLGAMLLVQTVGTILGAIHGYILGIVANRVGRDLRMDLYHRLQGHSMRFFHDSRSGDLVSRATGDVENVTSLATDGVDELIGSSLQLLIVWGIIFYLSWQVALTLLVPMALVALMVWRFNRRVRPLYRSVRARLGDISAKLQENIVGMAIIKAFAREQFEASHVRARSDEHYDASVRAVRAESFFGPQVSIVGFVSNLVMLGVGAYFVMQGSFTIGGLVALRGYWWRLFAPVRTMARVNARVQRSIAAAERIFTVMDAPVEVRDAEDAGQLEQVSGRIEFRDIRFAYSSDGPVVIEHLDALVEPGQMLGLAGPSGAGKSTILSMLMRYYEPQSGSIRIDGVDIREVTQQSLRSQMGLVSQEPFLFNDTIRRNLLFGRSEADEAQMHTAAARANAHQFILSLPEGYDTLVGERGVKLSGGQKQRICIARAFLADPRILLLDEATASVEPESEALIQAALGRLMQGRTSVVISHRLSMIREAAQILVILHGRVAERGTHEQLMARDGWYARMYRLQSGQEQLDAGQSS